MEKQKKCKNCGDKFTPYNSLMVTCSKRCYYQYIDKKRAEQMEHKRISDNLVKNTVRKVSEETKREVYERDGGRCVVCKTSENLESTPHHINFGLEAIYKPYRNDPDQLVTICVRCHYSIHSEGKTNIREICKDYVKTIYECDTK